MLRSSRHKVHQDSDDASLLEAYKRTGEQAVLAVLFERYKALVYGLSLKYLPPEDAEDAVMSIYLELQRKLPQHDIANFKNWLFTFVRNFCLMQLRSEKKMPEVEFQADFMQSDLAWHPMEEDGHDREATAQALQHCMDKLVELQQLCIRQFYLEGHSYKAIADQMGEDLGKIRSHIQNGRRNLKLCIEQAIKQ